MTKVLLAAAALLTTHAAASDYGPKGSPRQVRRTAVNHVTRSSSNSGSNGGAKFWGTPPPPETGPSYTKDSGMSRYTSGRSYGYSSSRGIGGGGWGTFGSFGSGRSLGSGMRGLGEGGRPDVIVPGQLIRSAGLGFKTSEPDTPPSLFAVNAGRISYDDIPGGYGITGAGTHHGPKDTLPPPNPTSGGSASGYTGITENRSNTTIINQKNKGTVNE